MHRRLDVAQRRNRGVEAELCEWLQSIEQQSVAVTHLAPSVGAILEGGVADPAVVPGIADLIEAHASTGETERAASLLSWLRARADRCDRRWARLAAARCEVLLAVPDAEDETPPGFITIEARVEKVHAHEAIVVPGTQRIRTDRWSPLLYVFRHYFGTGERFGRNFRAED